MKDYGFSLLIVAAFWGIPILLLMFCGACELLFDRVFGKDDSQEFDPPEGL